MAVTTAVDKTAVSAGCSQLTSPRDHSQAIIANNVAQCVDASPELEYTLLNWVELEDETTVVGAGSAKL